MTNLVYTPPGVYVDEDATPAPTITSVVALPPSRVALVGPSIGYQAFTETVQLGASPIMLTHTGIDESSIVVTSLAGIVYEETNDYIIDQSGSDPLEATTTIERDSGGAIGLDEIVYVQYQFTNTAYFQPFYSTDWDEIQSRFGRALASDGTISSPLSLAARIVLEQGAREIILVPTDSPSDLVTASQLEDAMGKLMSRSDVGIVVPLPIGVVGTDVSPGETTQVCTDLRLHVQNASSEGNYRIGMIGLDVGAERSHDVLANSISSRRVMLAFPNVMNWYNGQTNRVVELGGCYLAAAYAGTLAARSPQTPLTMKSIQSFASIPARVFTQMTRGFKNNLSSNGVAVIEQRSDGRLTIRHGVSTDMTNVLTREMSITRARDILLRLVDRSLTTSGAVGDALTITSPVDVRGIVEGALNQATSTGIIVSFSGLSVRVSPGDPTVLEVKFAYTPAYPLNQITVSFSINTTTGTIQEV